MFLSHGWKNDSCLMIWVQFSSLSHVQLFVTPWIAAHQASLSITNSWSSLKLMSIESVMPYLAHHFSARSCPLAISGSPQKSLSVAVPLSVHHSTSLLAQTLFAMSSVHETATVTERIPMSTPNVLSPHVNKATNALGARRWLNFMQQ